MVAFKIAFKWTLKFSKYVLTAAQSHFKPSLISQHYEPVLFQMPHHPYGTFTFKTKALRLVSDVQRI